MDEVSLDRVFIDYSIKKLGQMSSRIQDCLDRLDDRQVWLRGGESENAVGNLVLHLCGNVRQWIVSAVGGAADRRIRDLEFAARGEVSRQELAASLQAAIDDAMHVLAAVTPQRLLEPVTVQGYEVTVLECIYHVVEHFSGHVGQIIFATKAFTGQDPGYYQHLRAKAEHAEKTP